MKRYARVKDIIGVYKSGGIGSVAKYLTDENIIIEENTWEYKMKKLLESKKIASMEAEIASLSYIFNLSNDYLNERNRSYKSDDQGSEDGGNPPD